MYFTIYLTLNNVQISDFFWIARQGQIFAEVWLGHRNNIVGKKSRTKSSDFVNATPSSFNETFLFIKTWKSYKRPNIKYQPISFKLFIWPCTKMPAHFLFGESFLSFFYYYCTTISRLNFYRNHKPILINLLLCFIYWCESTFSYFLLSTSSLFLVNPVYLKMNVCSHMLDLHKTCIE